MAHALQLYKHSANPNKH